MEKSAAGEAMVREEGGSGISTSSFSSLLATTLSSSAWTCPDDGIDSMSQLERRRSDDDDQDVYDHNNNDTSRLPAIPVNLITARLLELLQQTTEQKRQVARLIRTIDPSISLEEWYQHDHLEYQQYPPCGHDYHRYDHHKEEEEEAANKTRASTCSGNISSQYNSALFLTHKVSQLRRQVALLSRDLLAAKARNRLLQDQLLHSFLPTQTSSSIIHSQRPPPLLPADEELAMKHTLLGVAKSRKCSEELDGEDKKCYHED